MWNQEEIRENLAKTSRNVGIRMPQAQLLLSQERLISRIFSLEESSHFVWKGGSLLLRLYQKLEVPRYTVDIDFLVKGIDFELVEGLLEKAMSIDLNDGFSFLDFKKESFVRDTPYGGDSYSIGWTFFGKPNSERLKLDICAGDKVEEVVIKNKDVFLLPDLERDISIRVYPAEYIFAEKLETAQRFYTGNTRLKDFIDLWTLSKSGVDKKKLLIVLKKCFESRKTVLDKSRLMNLFKEQVFINVMENRRKKKYAYMKIPTVSDMFEEIHNFLDGLNIV